MILQPYDVEVGAGTFHPATTLRALGPEPWKAAYVQPSRRPTDGRYGENPNRLQHYYQYQVILKPSPPDLQELYLRASTRSASTPRCTTSASSRTTGRARPWAPGAWAGRSGATAWRSRQFTYFQQVGGFDCRPVSGELTYGLERLAMYVQGVENVYDLDFNGAGRHATATSSCRPSGNTRRSISRSPTRTSCSRHFADAEQPLPRDPGARLPLPAYDQCLKASHLFNLLDARGVISVTERAAYIGRVRALAKACAEAWLAAPRPSRPKAAADGGAAARAALRGDPGPHAGPALREELATRYVGDALTGAGLGFDVPARLVRHAAPADAWRDRLASQQADRVVERKGPRAMRRQARAEASCVARGLDYALEERDDKKARVLFALVRERGRPVAELLAELLPQAIAALPGRSRCAGAIGEFRWVRPLQSILCLLDGAWCRSRSAGRVGRPDRGHRFMAPEPFAVARLCRLCGQAARRQGDPGRRRAARRSSPGPRSWPRGRGCALATIRPCSTRSRDWSSGRCRCWARIDARFMACRPRCWSTTMRTNQKYLALRTPDGAAGAPVRPRRQH